MKNTINRELFAERLKSLMIENNETIYSIAEIVHMSAATISRYINAEMTPKITTVEVLARYFNVNPEWLLGYDVEKNLDPNSNTEINTIAAHLIDEDFTDEELKEILEYAKYIKSKRK